jgi:hypothetical protein
MDKDKTKGEEAPEELNKIRQALPFSTIID